MGSHTGATCALPVSALVIVGVAGAGIFGVGFNEIAEGAGFFPGVAE